MNDQVAEKLIQSAATLIEQNVEINLLIRGSLAANATISAINSRIDALVGSAKQLEKGVQLDEGRLRQLEEQSEAIKEGFRAFEKTAAGLKAAIQLWDHKLGDLVELMKNVDKKSDSWWGRLNEMRSEEMGRWNDIRDFIIRLKWWISKGLIIHIVTVGVLVVIFILLMIR